MKNILLKQFEGLYQKILTPFSIILFSEYDETHFTLKVFTPHFFHHPIFMPLPLSTLRHYPYPPKKNQPVKRRTIFKTVMVAHFQKKEGLSFMYLFLFSLAVYVYLFHFTNLIY